MRMKLRKPMTVVLLCMSLLAGCAGATNGVDSQESGQQGTQGESANGATGEGVAPVDVSLVWRESAPGVQTTLREDEIRGMWMQGDTIYLWGTTMQPGGTAPADTSSGNEEEAEQNGTATSSGTAKETGQNGEDETSGTAKETEQNGTDPASGSGQQMTLVIDRFRIGEAQSSAVELPCDAATIEACTSDADGNLYYMTYLSQGWDEETQSLTGEEARTLHSADADGQERFQTALPLKENTYYGNASMTCADRNGERILIVSDVTGVALYDAETGTETARVYEKRSDRGGCLQVAALRDGTIVMYGYDEIPLMQEIDLQKKAAGRERALPEDAGVWDLSTGTEHDFYMEENFGIAGFDLDGDALSQVVSFTDSDLTIHNVEQILPVDAAHILVLYNSTAQMYYGRNGGFGSSGTDDPLTLSLLTRADPADIEERIEVTIATGTLTTMLTQRAAQFNKENDTYRIRLIDYSAYNTDDNWDGAAQQLNNDIIAGNVPDMIALSDGMPVASYFEKGVFEPLDDYLADDPEIEALLPNVQKAFQYDGMTYVVVPSYQILGVVAKRALTEKLLTWTPYDVEQILTEKDMEWRNLFGYNVPRDQLLYAITQVALDQFVDRTTYTCDFDSEQFYALMEFASHFPTQEEAEGADIDWNRMEVMWRNDEALLEIMQLGDFETYLYERYVTFGEDIELVGFPLGEKGDGCILIAEEQIGISSTSPHKEACWAFLRGYLLPSYQEYLPFGLPVTEDALEKAAQEATKPVTYKDENGVEQTSPRYYSIGGEDIEVEGLTQRDVEDVLDMIRSVDKSAIYDEQILLIIEEEAGAYLSGAKSVEEVARIIQNRVQVYLDEQ